MDRSMRRRTVHIRNSSSGERILLFKMHGSPQDAVRFKPERGIVYPHDTCKVRLRYALADLSSLHVEFEVVMVQAQSADMTEFDCLWEEGMKRGSKKRSVDLSTSSSAAGTPRSINTIASSPVHSSYYGDDGDDGNSVHSFADQKYFFGNENSVKSVIKRITRRRSVHIRNSSSGERILLFKMHGSPQDAVRFKPERGIVYPHDTCKVRLRYALADLSSLHVEFEVVMVKAQSADMTEFDCLWEEGMKRGSKKRSVDLSTSSSAAGTPRSINTIASSPVHSSYYGDDGDDGNSVHSFADQKYFFGNENSVNSAVDDVMEETKSVSSQVIAAADSFDTALFSPETPHTPPLSSPLLSVPGAELISLPPSSYLLHMQLPCSDIRTYAKLWNQKLHITALKVSPPDAHAAIDTIHLFSLLRKFPHSSLIHHITITSIPLLALPPHVLHSYVNLKSLDISKNDLQHLPALALPRLTSLNISNNSISSLLGIETYLSLTTFIVAGNRIASARQLQLLLTLAHSLEYIDMRENPVTLTANYSDNLISMLPRLKYVDGSKVISSCGSYASSTSTDPPSTTSLSPSSSPVSPALVPLQIAPGGFSEPTLYQSLSMTSPTSLAAQLAKRLSHHPNRRFRSSRTILRGTSTVRQPVSMSAPPLESSQALQYIPSITSTLQKTLSLKDISSRNKRSNKRYLDPTLAATLKYSTSAKVETDKNEVRTKNASAKKKRTQASLAVPTTGYMARYLSSSQTTKEKKIGPPYTNVSAFSANVPDNVSDSPSSPTLPQLSPSAKPPRAASHDARIDITSGDRLCSSASNSISDMRRSELSCDATIFDEFDASGHASGAYGSETIAQKEAIDEHVVNTAEANIAMHSDATHELSVSGSATSLIIADSSPAIAKRKSVEAELSSPTRSTPTSSGRKKNNTSDDVPTASDAAAYFVWLHQQDEVNSSGESINSEQEEAAEEATSPAVSSPIHTNIAATPSHTRHPHVITSMQRSFCTSSPVMTPPLVLRHPRVLAQQDAKLSPQTPELSIVRNLNQNHFFGRY